MSTMTIPMQRLWIDQGVNIPTRVFGNSRDAVKHVAAMIENLIREKQAAGVPCVLGLPTGSTPVAVYRELIRLHQEEGLDFSSVITFNLDEYYPMLPTQPQSYHRFMMENFFDHINIKPKNIHIPDGTVSIDSVDEYCENYEHEIRRAGGLDLLLLGIGRTGHVGFNEPGSLHRSRTRLVRLHPVTRKDAASAFYDEKNVPIEAITMGIGTVLDARKIVLMAFGEHKADIVKRTLEGGVTEQIPATALQTHTGSVFVLDSPAASELSAIRTPWLVDRVDWTEEMVRRAVVWLAFTAKKAILKLTEEDFASHNLHELARELGPVDKLCRRIFEDRFATICNEPAGKQAKRIICFSPHPDDDVISMGGTLLRLAQQAHDLHIAYMTSGNVAVFDHDAIRFANFVTDFNKAFGIDTNRAEDLENRVRDFLARKQPTEVDSPEVLAIKSLVRKTEAIAGARVVGVDRKNLHFLDLPFYQTGRVTKKRHSEDDIQLVSELLEKIRPSQIYVAGDLADPHGTHRICAEIIFHACERYFETDDSLEVWLYRGAWQEWEPHQIERAVPLSPEDLDRKKSAIFRHESQKDRAMFPGSTDPREFWQRAEDRNRGTARLYDQLGLPEFYAIEGFVRWDRQMP